MPSIFLAARGRITTHFHQDIGRGWLHRGIDQGHGDGLPVDLEIRAPAAGVVTFAGLFGSYGLVLFITHDDGWVSVLAHHSKHLVKQGQRVTQRQLIAVMGNSGTKYVHNHQELRDAAGEQVDPLLHLSETTAPATSDPATTIPVPAPVKRRNDMPLGYYTTNHGALEWAVADGSTWAPVTTQDEANATAALIGNFIKLTVPEYAAKRAAYLRAPTK